MCSNRVLWLLSYIGLSVALALGNGNRQSAALEPRSASSPNRQHQQPHQQHPQHSQMRDWLSYDRRTAATLPHERLVLLDDVLTNVLDDLQQHQSKALPPAAPATREQLPRSRRSRPQAQQQVKRRNPTADKSKRRISASRRQQQQQQLPQQDPQEIAQALAQAGQSMAASNFMFNSRNDRSYDVPLIECPMSEDGMERFACPTADRMGRYHCIDDHVLCDGYLDCPMGEDEDMQACMFYKTTKAHIDILADALLRWARGR